MNGRYVYRSGQESSVPSRASTAEHRSTEENIPHSLSGPEMVAHLAREAARERMDEARAVSVRQHRREHAPPVRSLHLQRGRVFLALGRALIRSCATGGVGDTPKATRVIMCVRAGARVRVRAGVRAQNVCVRACMRACVRARVRALRMWAFACVRACVRVRVCVRARASVLVYVCSCDMVRRALTVARTAIPTCNYPRAHARAHDRCVRCTGGARKGAFASQLCRNASATSSTPNTGDAAVVSRALARP